MIRKIRIAKNNPNFSLNDDSRVLFYDKEYATKNNKSVSETIEITKNAWIADTFDVEIEIKSFNQPNSRLNAEVKVAVNDDTIEKYMNVRYLMLNNYKSTGELINSEFYFVNKNRIANANVVSLSLRLDSVTTYFDKLSFGKSTKIERRHFDRWKINGGKIIANNDEDSGIWNDESDIQNNTFVYKKNYPINVFNDQVYNGLSSFIKKEKFYPIGLVKVRAYNEYGIDAADAESKLQGNSDTSFNLTVIPFDLGRVNFYSGLDGSKIANPEGVELKRFNAVNSAYIERIFAAPLPFVPQQFIDQYGNVRAMNNDPSGGADINVDYNTYAQAVVDNAGAPADIALKPSSITSNSYITPYNGKVVKVGYLKEIETSNIINNSIAIANLNDDYDYTREIKLETTKHKRLTLKSINGQKIPLINEFLLSDDKIKIDIKLSVSMEGVFQYVKIKDNPYYDNANKSNSNTLVVSYKDQIPNASNIYNNFMATQGNQYKTALSNNRVKSVVGTAMGALGGIVGGVTGNFLGGGASLVSGGNSALNGYLKERQYKAQVKDLSNMGTTTEVNDVSIIKDVALVEESLFGDSKLTVSVEEHPTIHKVEISNLYNKIGYSANLTEKVEDYAWFSKRSRFTFIQAPLISDSVEKVNIGEEIIEDINSVFNNGVRLWNVNAQGKVDINNYGKENWEHAIKAKIDEIKVPRI